MLLSDWYNRAGLPESRFMISLHWSLIGGIALPYLNPTSWLALDSLRYMREFAQQRSRVLAYLAHLKNIAHFIELFSCFLWYRFLGMLMFQDLVGFRLLVSNLINSYFCKLKLYHLEKKAILIKTKQICWKLFGAICRDLLPINLTWLCL